MHYVYLIIAIVTEVIATSALKASDSFTRLWPSLIVVVGYLFSFYFLSLTLKFFPVGVTYAIWSGVGIIFISIVAFLMYNQQPDLPAVIGIVFIILGVIIINLFSKTISH